MIQARQWEHRDFDNNAVRAPEKDLIENKSGEMINGTLQDGRARGDWYWLIADTISALLLLLFLYTALSKLAGYKVFAVALKDFQVCLRNSLATACK